MSEEKDTTSTRIPKKFAELLDAKKQEGISKTKFWAWLIGLVQYADNYADPNKTFDASFGLVVFRAHREELIRLHASVEEIAAVDLVIQQYADRLKALKTEEGAKSES